MEANPDKVPYKLNHSSKRSFPELYFEGKLKELDIQGWVSEYNISIYRLDFAFPDIKLDVEIDGGTHEQEKVKQIDKRRDEYMQSQGWTVLRLSAKALKKDVYACLDLLKTHLK